MNKVQQYDELDLKKFKMKSILPDATILILGKRRSGKCFIGGTKVLMYDGTTQTIENIKKGDLVMGDDSLHRTVLDTHSGYDMMYKITNQFRESYIVNSEHILSLVCHYKPVINDRKGSFKIKWFDNKIFKIRYKIFKYNDNNKENVYKKLVYHLAKNTSEIVNIPITTYLSLSNTIKSFFKGYQTSVYFKENELEINPYLYGLIVNKHYKYTRDSKIIVYLQKTLYLYDSYLYFNTVNQTYEINGKLSDYINNYGIRKNYKINTVENRFMLLMGILDMNKFFKNGHLTILQHEIDDIYFLIKSLGYSIHTINKGDVLHAYIFNGDLLLLEKKDFVFKHIPKYIENDIIIEKLSIDKYYGFEIDGNSLFLLDNMVVVHNSWLVRDLFYHHKHIPSGIVFSGTEEANPFFADFIPDCFIHNEYDAEIIEKMMNKQKKRIKDAKRAGVDNGKTPSNNLFIVFDDMLADANNWKNDKVIKEIFFNGRHYNFLFVLTMQYALAIPPGLRGNIDYVFVFNEPSLKNRRKIYEDYAAMIPSFDHFCNILDACTQNHECLVIKTSGNSSNLQDNIFWYKSELHKNFRVGHYKLWKFHNQHYNKNYEEENIDEEERVQDLKEKFSNTKKLKVIVSRKNDNIVDIKY